VNEIKLPALMLQPYVENAIWHGLMNKKEEFHRILSLQFTEKENILEVRIEDNGVGRRKAAAFSKHGYKPKGTSINSRRAEILSILSEEKGAVLVEDVFEGETVAGTRVIITIPQEI
jgi:LytS/YehU family sensor histidine kinase